MNLAIIGPQGSGKGTQAELLVKRFGFERIETGAILRKIVDGNTPTATIIKETMEKGELVSDEILEKILTDELKDMNTTGFLFDGTPRNLIQYNLLNKILNGFGQKLDKVVVIFIDEAESIKRMTSRRTCDKCGRIYNLITNPSPLRDKCECGGELELRDDDTEEAIKLRLFKYRQSTVPVINQAKKDGILILIDGECPIEEIHNDIVNKLGL